MQEPGSINSTPEDNLFQAALAEAESIGSPKEGFGKRMSSWLVKRAEQIGKLKESIHIPKPHLPDVSMPHMSMPHISTPHIPKPHMPEVSLPSIPKPDLSGVGEALGNVREIALKNRITGTLYFAGESYLSKFTPEDKDVKAWVGGILGGASTVIAVAEAGATLGFSPAIRGVAVTATLNVADLIYSQLHRIYIDRALGRFVSYLKPEGVNKAELRKQIMDLEKSMAAKKLTGQDFMNEYSDQLNQLLTDHTQGAEFTDETEAYLTEEELAQICEQLTDRLVKLGRDYATVNKTARSLAAGMSAGSMVGALGEVGVRTLLKGFPGGILSQETLGLPKTEGVAVTPPTPTATVTETITTTPTPSATSVPGVVPPEAGIATETATPTFTPTPTEAPTFTPTTTVGAGGQLPTETPTATLTPTETATPTAALPPVETTTPVVTSTPAPTVETTPAPVSTSPTTPELPPDLKDKLNVLESTREYKTEIAAEVGKYLPARDEILNEALKAKGVLPAEIDVSSFDAGKEAALHVMEGKGNEIFDQAAREVLTNNPNADVSQITEAAQKAYADWLSSADAQTQIAEAAQNAIADHLQIENTLAEKVTDGLSSHTDWFVDVPLERGVTVGKILDLTWTPADAPVMGANIAANYDLLTDMWGNMAKVHPDLLANGNFPVSLSELNDLVARAEAGDEAAIKKLRQALHWIPAGSKFRAVAASASREVLNLVK